MRTYDFINRQFHSFIFNSLIEVAICYSRPTATLVCLTDVLFPNFLQIGPLTFFLNASVNYCCV